MSVVGFDFGNLNCYIAVARQGGIEVITNDYSLHATPSCVSFGPRNRSIGVSARQQVNSNLKNTVLNFKHLIGRKFSDEHTQRIKEFVPCDVVQTPGDNIGLKVNYLGEERVFTPEQILAALLVKLKDTTSHSLSEVSKVTDCVISVPFFFTDTQRRCLIAACQMADLNCLRILNETTAVALAYGIYKQDLPVEPEKPRIVMFIDAGHSAMQTCLVAYNKGKLTVLGSAFDLSVGGLAFDIILREHFRTMFINQFKIDAATNARAWLRLLDECEKVKKQMSANSTTIPLNIECFMDGKDVSGKIQRTEFEQLSEHIFDKIRNFIRRALDDCRKKPADVDEIEIIGGSSRIPMIRKIISDIFGKDAKTTMNQDEAVARGCAMQCAILSPSFRVREFAVKDSQPFRIKLAWGPVGLTDGGENDVFQERDEFPFSKMLTLYRTEPFQLNATYSLPNQVPYLRREIGSWKILNVTPNEAGESRKVKVKVRVNPNGIFAVCSASIYNTIPALTNTTETTDEMMVDAKENGKNSNADSNEQQQPPIDSDAQQQPPTGACDNDNMNTDENKSEEAAADRKDKKSKTKTQVIDLPIEESTPSPYSALLITSFKDIETSMQQTDRREKEKADAKNTVEEYVYEMREKLCDQLAEFVDEQDANAFRSLLSATEEWLYDEGDDVEKSVYAAKLSDLKKFGDPIVERYREFELRGSAFASLGRALQLTRKEYDLYLAKDEKYSHIDDKDMARIHKIIEEKQRWLDDSVGRQERRRKSEPPIVFAHQIAQEQQALENVVRPILNKPKPTPPPPAPKKEQPTAPTTEDGNGVASGGDDNELQQPTAPVKPKNVATSDRDHVTRMEVD